MYKRSHITKQCLSPNTQGSKQTGFLIECCAESLNFGEWTPPSVQVFVWRIWALFSCKPARSISLSISVFNWTTNQCLGLSQLGASMVFSKPVFWTSTSWVTSCHHALKELQVQNGESIYIKALLRATQESCVTHKMRFKRTLRFVGVQINPEAAWVFPHVFDVFAESKRDGPPGGRGAETIRCRLLGCGRMFKFL